MKNFLTKYFGYLGLLVYGIFSAIIRIPVGAFLLFFFAVIFLVWGPLTRTEPQPKWLDRLYNWYWGK